MHESPVHPANTDSCNTNEIDEQQKGRLGRWDYRYYRGLGSVRQRSTLDFEASLRFVLGPRLVLYAYALGKGLGKEIH